MTSFFMQRFKEMEKGLLLTRLSLFYPFTFSKFRPVYIPSFFHSAVFSGKCINHPVVEFHLIRFYQAHSLYTCRILFPVFSVIFFQSLSLTVSPLSYPESAQVSEQKWNNFQSTEKLCRSMTKGSFSPVKCVQPLDSHLTSKS